MQNLIEVLERVHIQFDDISCLVVNADRAVLEVLAGGSSVVRVGLPHRSLPCLVRLADAFEALLCAASQAGEHLVLVRGHQSILGLSVALVAFGGTLSANVPGWRISARRRHSVGSMVPFRCRALVVHSLSSMAADIPLSLVGHFAQYADHLFRSNLVRLELCWLNHW